MGVEYGSVDSIEISQIVARTKIRLQIKDLTDFDDEIELFINEAASSLGAKPSFVKKNCKLEIVNGRAKLPCGFKFLLGVIPVCEGQISENEELRNSLWVNGGQSSPLLYLEQTFMQQCLPVANTISNCPQIIPLQGVMQIQGNYLVVSLPTSFTHVIISYDGYAVDGESGILIMHPSYERPFSEYATYMMLRSYPALWNNDWGNRESELNRANQDWVAGRMKLVSDAFADDFRLNNYMVKRILHGLLQDQAIAVNY